MRVSVGVSMSQDLVDDIDACKDPEESRSEYIRRAVRRHMQHNETNSDGEQTPVDA